VALISCIVAVVREDLEYTEVMMRNRIVDDCKDDEK
jgi:hypothetical protein